MPLDKLPGELALPTRDELKAKWLRDFLFRAPPGTSTTGQPEIDAATVADTAVPIYAAARKAAQGITLDDAIGAALDTQADQRGLTRRGAFGASGGVTITAASGGGTIFAGDELRDPTTGTRYVCAISSVYANGDTCTVKGLDTGPGTNRKQGAVLQWTSPRPGIGPNATVALGGLTGGRESESDNDLRERIRDRNENPPASGNDAQYQDAAEKTPSVSVQKAFTYPAVGGPAMIGLTFTMLPASPGAGRIPNSGQLGLVDAWVRAQFPADDGLVVSALLDDPVDVALSVQWRDDVAQWADLAPWPLYAPLSGSGIVVASATSALVFVLQVATGGYGGVTAPVAGKTIAFYDAQAGLFRRKRILSVSGAGPWTITCDTAQGASDASYTPAVSQRAMPWSDSLQLLKDPVVNYFDHLGPGEQFASFPDPGGRQKRSPPSPKEWPSVVANRLITDVLGVAAVDDAQLLEPTIPRAATVGTPGVSSYLLSLHDLAAFPL